MRDLQIKEDIMADKDLEMDVAPEEQKSSSKMMLIIIVLVVLLTVGGVAAFFLLGTDSEAPEQEAPAQESIKPAIYLPLRPSFVVNFMNVGGKTHFLQAEVTLMGRDQAFMDSLGDHMPLIKSKLVEVFGIQDFEELRTPEGKDTLRTVALEELQTLFEEELGDPGIEKLYFTIFILQ